MSSDPEVPGTPGTLPGPAVGHVEVDPDALRTTIVLNGEVDAGLEDELGALCAAVAVDGPTAGHSVAVDLGAVTFLDSAGIAFLVRLTQRVAPRRVRVLSPPEQVRLVLDVTGVATILDLG